MSSDFVRTQTVLDKILDRKTERLIEQKASVSQQHLMEAVQFMTPPRNIVAPLRRETVALIAEIKQASPSRGVLTESFDPVALGTVYARYGAAAISVLTEESFFLGSLDHLVAVRRVVGIPVLRKDFVIDPYQVYEGRAAGADAILLIVAALADSQLADLHALIMGLGMTALVEVHDEQELERALRIKPKLIGINNRDLKTFEVDLATTERLARLVPPGITLVAESGIRSGAAVCRMGRAGVHAVLVGEALVQAGEIAVQVQEFSRQPRQETL
jgi:indole-3-glycerol phosphate synthase